MKRSPFVLALLAGGLAAGGCKSSSGPAPKEGCPAADELISDFEQDNSLAPVGGRQGGWYTYGDTLGHFANTATGYDIAFGAGNPGCTPGGALHIMGTDFAMWGAATGVDWRPRPPDGDGGYGDKMTYDASMYRGVSFWAKASAPLDGVQVSFPDLYTDGYAPSHDMPDPTDPAAPLVCNASDGPCKCLYNAQSTLNCSPYLVQFGLKGDAAAAVAYAGYGNDQLDTTWKLFKILFVDTKQDPGNGGYHLPSNRISLDKLTAMAIQINADYSTGVPVARNFEIWLDDIGFIK